MAGEAKSLSPRQCAVMDVALDTIKVSLYCGFGFMKMYGGRVEFASSTIYPLLGCYERLQNQSREPRFVSLKLWLG